MKTIPAGRKKLIYVHRQKIEKNEPALSVRYNGKASHHTKVAIQGPSLVVHEPLKNRQPRAWIETHAKLVVS